MTPLQLHRLWQPACLPRQHLQQVMPRDQEGTALLHVKCMRLMFRALPCSIRARASRSRPSGLLKLWQHASRHRLQHLLHRYPIYPDPDMGRHQEEDLMPAAVTATHPLLLHHQPQHLLKIL